MTIPVATNIGSIVQNTNGTSFKILENARPAGGTNNPPIVAEDTTSGEIQYFNADGTADNILHANLVLTVSDIPPNDINPGFVINLGMICRTRDGTKVRVDSATSSNHFRVKQVDNFFDFFGYEVWSSGMRNNSGTDNGDLVDIWNDPTQLGYWVYVDKTNPGDKTLWGDLLPASPRPNLASTPQGKKLMYIALREPINDNQNFTLTVS